MARLMVITGRARGASRGTASAGTGHRESGLANEEPAEEDEEDEDAIAIPEAAAGFVALIGSTCARFSGAGPACSRRATSPSVPVGRGRFPAPAPAS